MVSKHLIILDWDDTLFPTTHLKTEIAEDSALENLTSSKKSSLESLESAAVSLIRTALQLGEVKIVTNANMKWVDRTCSRFMPYLRGIVFLTSITIVSARDDALAGRNPASWKKYAFTSLVTKGKTQFTKVVSIGDAENDRESTMVLKEMLPHQNINFIKILPSRTIHGLQSKLHIIELALLAILESNNGIDIAV